MSTVFKLFFTVAVFPIHQITERKHGPDEPKLGWFCGCTCTREWVPAEEEEEEEEEEERRRRTQEQERQRRQQTLDSAQ